MDKKIKFSVILPIFNAEKTLNKCLGSLLAQTYNNFEVICIDDGSKDHSLEVLNNYAKKDSRIIVVSKNNGGVSSARNIGLDRAKGEFIVFLDSDDWVSDRWLQDYVEHYSGEDLLYQNSIWHIDGKPDVVRSITINDVKQDVLTKIIFLHGNGVLPFVWAGMFKSSILKDNNIKFNEFLIFNEDCTFVLDYCHYVQSVNILSAQNYHYVYPIAGDKPYFESSSKKVLASYEEGVMGYKLCFKRLHLFESINIKTSIAMLLTIYIMYLENQPKQERKRAIKIVDSLPYKRKVVGVKFKIMNALFFKPYWLCDSLFRVIMYINSLLVKLKRLK